MDNCEERGESELQYVAPVTTEETAEHKNATMTDGVKKPKPNQPENSDGVVYPS